MNKFSTNDFTITDSKTKGELIVTDRHGNKQAVNVDEYNAMLDMLFTGTELLEN